MPLRRVAGNLVTVPVRVDGLGPFEFLLDTGTNTTLIDAELVRQLGLKPVDRVQLSAVNGDVTLPRYKLQTISLGNAPLNDVEALGGNFPALQSLHPDVRGILGLNALLGFSMRIDLRHSRLELFEPGENYEARGASVPMELTDEAIVVAATTNSARHGQWRLAVDSGISQLLVFEGSVASARPSSWMSSVNGIVLTNPEVKVETGVGTSHASSGRIEQLVLGGQHLEKVDVVVAPRPNPGPESAYDGLLPCALFGAVLFDFQKRVVIFEPR